LFKKSITQRHGGAENAKGSVRERGKRRDIKILIS
jgi:hypothetical protein